MFLRKKVDLWTLCLWQKDIVFHGKVTKLSVLLTAVMHACITKDLWQHLMEDISNCLWLTAKSLQTKKCLPNYYKHDNISVNFCLKPDGRSRYINEDSLYYIDICRLLEPYNVYFPSLIACSACMCLFFILNVKSFT